MEVKIKFLIALVFFFSNGLLNAQSPAQIEIQKLIEQRIETLANLIDNTGEMDYSSLIEDLNYFANHRINLNAAEKADLQSLLILDDTQINSLYKHIAVFGKLKSIFEIQSIVGIDLETIQWMRPFVYVNEENGFSDFTLRKLKEEGTHDILLRSKRTFQQQAGFIPDEITGKKDFLGSEYGTYLRYRFQYRRNLSFGLTIENDVGEPLRKGPDFKSASLFIREARALKQLVIGDYQVQFGQGLTCWNSMAFGKSSFSVQVKRNGQNIKPYSSVNESSFFRGAGVTVGKRWVSATLFASRRKLDATLGNDSLIGYDQVVVNSISLSGLHRTESERASKNVLTENILGGNIQIQKGMWKAGMVGLHRTYSDSISARTEWYASDKFAGRTQYISGVYAEGVIKNSSVFGEVSRSANGAIASVFGITSALHPRFSSTLLFRNFAKDFQSIVSNVIAEGSGLLPANERGIYMSIQSQLSKKFSLNAYTDGVQFPWLRYQVSGSSNFTDNLFQINYKPDKKNECYLRIRIRRTSTDRSVSNRIDFPVDKYSAQIRFNFIFSPSESIKFHGRIEWLRTNEEGLPNENGYLIFQDVIWKKMNCPVTFTFRYALFQTDSWNARLYAYENDVLYSYSIPVYYGKGTRVYGIFKFDVRRNIDVWFRLAQWVYTDRDVISSGDTAIQGFRKTDCTLQLRMQF